ncbi:MAG: sulfate adenylyltransferase subunit CysN [Kiritimatiellaeota bacterium]|nr:sulfate adenylyltransferase subunit CysN [Kiritimatiellota bacterium]
MTIDEFLQKDAKKDLLKFSTAGSVDDGKSTLIGRLLHDSKSIYDDQLTSLRGTSRDDEQEIDYAFITDGLKAEREQGITIDVAYRYFSTPKRKFIIADTPGHIQYTRNMATGASTANLALILIDAEHGVVTQSKRHSFIAALLGIPHLLVAVNKMDLVGYDQKIFEKIKSNFANFAAKLSVKDVHFIPVSALKGDNVVERGSANMPWYNGPTVMSYLEDLYISSDVNLVDLRIPVQYVLRPDNKFRGYCGKMASGVFRTGDEIVALPSKKRSRVKSIHEFEGETTMAHAPMSVTFTLEDELDISRGDMICHKNNIPRISRRLESMVVWMGEQPLESGKSYIVKHTTKSTKAFIDSVRFKINIDTLSHEQSESLTLNEIGRVVITTNQPLIHDTYSKNRNTGSFILIDPLTNATSGAGMILERESTDIVQPAEGALAGPHSFPTGARSLVTRREREKAYNQKAATIWLTGLHASGKSEVAYELEKSLFHSGAKIVTLTGLTLRSGLTRELNFDLSDRWENLRRAAEIARLLNENGIICVCAFISPDSAARSKLAEIVGKNDFLEIHVDAPLEICRKRDKTGLYEKAELGTVKNVAGISFPYEKPEKPALKLDMRAISYAEAAKVVTRLLEEKGIVSGDGIPK